VRYQVRVQGELGPSWQEWFAGSTITRQAGGVTLLTCELTDQAALFGLLRRLQDLGVPLLSITKDRNRKGETGMNVRNGTSRMLGIAFLLQAVTSLASGMILKLGLFATRDVGQDMAAVANRPWLLQANILGETITAAGVIFLGAVLYTVLKKQDARLALAGFGLYILEGVLLAVSRLGAFALLGISPQYAAGGHPALLETIGGLAIGVMDNGYTLLMAAFGVGAVFFYWLLFRSRVVPRPLSLWGLVTDIVVLAATVAKVFGVEVPFAVYVPYVPFEFVIGGWILARGLSANAGEARNAATA